MDIEQALKCIEELEKRVAALEARTGVPPMLQFVGVALNKTYPIPPNGAGMIGGCDEMWPGSMRDPW